MHSINSNSFRASFGVAALLVASACSAPAGVSGTTPSALEPASAIHVPLGKTSKALLYVSDDGTNEVQYFTWPKPKESLGSLPGFSEPQGGCSDTSGDVFISNTGDQNVLEYDGTKEVGSLNDAGQFPVGCSFDTVNGDLAVGDIVTTGDGAGNIAIYKNAEGAPKQLPVNGMQRVFAPQYDGSGDLFALGENASNALELAEKKAGSKGFKIVCPNLFGGASEFIGGLGWDGRYIVIATGNDLERIEDCKIVGRVAFTGASDVDEFTIVEKYLIAADAGNAVVDIYEYPKGGKPLQVISGFSEPVGVAVSQDVKSQ